MNINFIIDHDNTLAIIVVLGESAHTLYVTNLVSCADKGGGRSYDCAVVLDTGKHCVGSGTMAVASQQANYNSYRERDIVLNQSDVALGKE